MAANCMNFGSELFGCFENFCRDQPRNGIGLAEMGHHGACFTANHHSLVTYEGHGMAQQQQMSVMAANCMNFGSELFGCYENFSSDQPKKGPCLAEMGHQELVSQQIITHW